LSGKVSAQWSQKPQVGSRHARSFIKQVPLRDTVTAPAAGFVDETVEQLAV
jgi:hypothetical protein